MRNCGPACGSNRPLYCVTAWHCKFYTAFTQLLFTDHKHLYSYAHMLICSYATSVGARAVPRLTDESRPWPSTKCKIPRPPGLPLFILKSFVVVPLVKLSASHPPHSFINPRPTRAGVKCSTNPESPCTTSFVVVVCVPGLETRTDWNYMFHVDVDNRLSFAEPITRNGYAYTPVP